MTRKSNIPSGEQVEIQKRRKRVVAARVRGASFREIAKREEIGVSTAHNDYTTALADIPKPEVDELRKLEGERLDALQAAVWEEAMLGDTDAGQQALRVIGRRAKLFGLDAPQKLDVSAGDVDLDATVAKILAVAEIAIRGKGEA